MLYLTCDSLPIYCLEGQFPSVPMHNPMVALVKRAGFWNSSGIRFGLNFWVTPAFAVVKLPSLSLSLSQCLSMSTFASLPPFQALR